MDSEPTNTDIPTKPVELRSGFTTGACAAVAAGAAATVLAGGTVDGSYSVESPGGRICLPVEVTHVQPGHAVARVIKDAGDDPDITNGIEIRVDLTAIPEPCIRIDGGDGVGRLTKPGLDQPVGAAAINRMPRKMITDAVENVRKEFGFTDGFDVIVSIPEGKKLAARTFNPRLGIVGGLSVLGTTGIVEPMSTRALLDSLRAEMRMHRAGGARVIVITPGKYGENFLAGFEPLQGVPSVVTGNYIGEALDLAVQTGFRGVVVVGHIGKMIKLSGGILDTHSKVADGRLELLGLYAALAGVPPEGLEKILASSTVDQGLETVREYSPLQPVLDRMVRRGERYIHERIVRAGGEAVLSGLVTFSHKGGLVHIGSGVERILEMNRTDAI